MIQEFSNGVYTYRLASPSLVISKVKLNGVDISKYLSNESTVSWYDVSKDSGRSTTTASGKMVLNVISTKYRLDLRTRPLTEDEVVDFYAQIIKSPKITVQFLNPFTKSWKTIKCYRGDRSVQAMQPKQFTEGTETVLRELYNAVSQAIIEL